MILLKNYTQKIFIFPNNLKYLDIGESYIVFKISNETNLIFHFTTYNTKNIIFSLKIIFVGYLNKMNYHDIYIKYKNKYIKLKNQLKNNKLGGECTDITGKEIISNINYKDPIKKITLIKKIQKIDNISNIDNNKIANLIIDIYSSRLNIDPNLDFSNFNPNYDDNNADNEDEKNNELLQ